MAKDSRRETLSEYVRRILAEKKLTAAAVEERSKRGGRKGITRGYVSQIKNGTSLNPSTEKLRALAAGLGVSEEEVFAVARGAVSMDDESMKNSPFLDMALKFDALTRDGRARVSPFVDNLAEILERELNRTEQRKQR